MVRRFLALRWCLLRNSYSSLNGARVNSLALGALFGLLMAVLGLAMLASTGRFTPADALVTTAVISSLVTGFWLVAPLLYGVDDTLDPARLVLLPLTRRQLTTGLLAASVVSVPAVVTFLAISGTVIAAGQHGLIPALVAVLGVPLGVAVCLVGSRAFATAFARFLTSRRVRDLATFVGFLLAAGVWLAWITLTPRLSSASSGESWYLAARVLSWTPLAAPWTAWWDAANGRGAAAAAKLLIGVAAVLVLQWWWGRSLASVMTGGAMNRRSGSAARAGHTADLIPRWLRQVLPTGAVGAVVGRTVRMWSRDTRFRIALAGNLIIPVALALTWRSAPVEVIVAITGCAAGLALANTFGYDGPAYATHLLAGFPARLDLRARMIANALVAVPIVLIVAVAVSLFRGDTGAIVPAIGAGLAGLGCTALLCAVFSARMPFVPAPPEKPFSAPPDGALRGVVSAYGSLLGGMALSSPVLVLALLARGDHATSGAWWDWLMLPVGLAWAIAAAEVGAMLGGRAADRFGPEIILAVTPNR